MRRVFRLLAGILAVMAQVVPAESTDLRIAIRALEKETTLELVVSVGAYRLQPDGGRPALQLVAGEGLEIRRNTAGGWAIRRGTSTLMSHEFRLEPLSAASRVFLRGQRVQRHLQGRLWFKSRSQEWLIADLPIEDYLTSVVPSEMPSGWEFEALKSQAILARTYSLHQQLENRHGDYDLCDLQHCQVYLGTATESRRTHRAVLETRGQILSQARSGAAQIFYHSTCGGTTTDARNVFEGARQTPWVSDQERAGAFCRSSPHFRWEYRLSTSDFQRFLVKLVRQKPPVGPIQKLKILERDPSERVLTMEFFGSRGTFKMTGHEFRTRFVQSFGQQSLKSTLFYFSRDRDEIVLSGRGFGHGVGFCQWGARGLAQNGSDHRQILQHYFPKHRIVVALDLAAAGD